MQRITASGTEPIKPSLESMPESVPSSETPTKCPECKGSGFKSGGRTCDCKAGQFQRDKDVQDERAFEKEYAENLCRIANIPKRFGQASEADYDEDYFWQIARKIDIKRGRGLFIWGPVGSGKTHLAAAILIGHLECNKLRNTIMTADGFTTLFLFVQLPDLLDRIRSGYEDRRTDAEDWLDRASNATVLVLDDIGAERVTDWVREKVFQLVNRRYNDMRATIVTSNLSPDELSNHIGDRTVSRLIEMCEVIQLTGEDRRLKPQQLAEAKRVKEGANHGGSTN